MLKYKPTIIYTILAMSGGLMDIYSYLYRDEVFANAQTGNIILFGINLANGNPDIALRYLCPILCFVLGIIMSVIIKKPYIIAILEAIILCIVCPIPISYNLVANSLISLVCGMQLEGFNEIYGHKIATTMCIGNLKNTVEHLCAGRWAQSLLYFWTIISFVIGAVIGSIVIRHLQQNTLLICADLLLIVSINVTDIEFNNKHNLYNIESE